MEAEGLMSYKIDYFLSKSPPRDSNQHGSIEQDHPTTSYKWVRRGHSISITYKYPTLTRYFGNPASVQDLSAYSSPFFYLFEALWRILLVINGICGGH